MEMIFYIFFPPRFSPQSHKVHFRVTGYAIITLTGFFLLTLSKLRKTWTVIIYFKKIAIVGCRQWNRADIVVDTLITTHYFLYSIQVARKASWTWMRQRIWRIRATAYCRCLEESTCRKDLPVCRHRHAARHLYSLASPYRSTRRYVY